MDVLPERGSQGCVARWAVGSADQRPEPASAGPPVTMRLGFRPLAAQPVGCSRARSASSLLSLEGTGTGASRTARDIVPREPWAPGRCEDDMHPDYRASAQLGEPGCGAGGPLAQRQGPGLGRLPHAALWHPRPRSQVPLGSPSHPTAGGGPHLSSFSWSRSSRAPSSRSSRCRARSSPQSSSARPCPAGGGQA